MLVFPKYPAWLWVLPSLLFYSGFFHQQSASHCGCFRPATVWSWLLTSI